jgi:hypothetical protein
LRDGQSHATRTTYRSYAHQHPKYTDEPYDPADYSSGKINFQLNTEQGAKGNATLLASRVVQPGSLADYCGFPVGLIPTYSVVTDTDDRNQFSALKMLSVLDIFYHYYVNQQIENFPTASFTPTLNLGSEDERNVEYPVSTLRSFLDYVKRAPNPAIAISKWTTENSVGDPFFGTWSWFCSRASIFQRCLPPYYLESWLATSGYEDSEIKVDLDADGKSISFRNIAAQSHIQRWLDLSLAGGARYTDYLDSHFDVSRLKHTTSPLYLGSDRQYLGSNVIYQTTGAGDPSSPLGAFAGQASGGETFRKRSYHFGENADGLKRRSSPARIRVNEIGIRLPGARVVGETCERFTFDFLFLRRVKNIMPIIKNNKSVVVE